MDNIIYEEEPTKEEVFSGTYVIDGRVSPEEQRERILSMMRLAGVEVENEDALEIGYDGVEDDNGISETQSTPFHVYQTVMKKVPYSVTREEIFNGTYIIDQALTPEEQREKIFAMMRTAGVEIGDESTLEIGYDGVEDNEGLSETQSTPFTVFRVTKTRMGESKISNELKEELEASMKEIKDLREKLGKIADSEERKRLINELFEKTDLLASRIGDSYGMNDTLARELEEIDEQILELQKSLKKAVKEYEDSFHRMEAILDEQTKAFESGMHSEEELDEIRREFAKRKLEENEKSAQIRKEIEEQKKLLTNLKRKKNKIAKDLGRAEDLGISVAEFQDINATLQKTNIMNAILEQKGLDKIVEKKATERTEEEKKQLKKAKEEVVQEISEAKKQDKDLSILDAIEALYSVQVQYTQGRPPRVLLVKESQLEQIKKNVEKVPERIVGDAKVYNYQPEEIPEDLAEADMHYQREEVFSGTYILDGERISEQQQRQKIFNMMRLAGIDVQDESDYEIGYEGVEDDNGISETQSTKFVVYRKIKEDKRVEDPVEKEEEKPIVDYSDSKGFDERIVLFSDVNNEGDIYVRDYVIKRFNLIPISGEVRIEESLCYRIEPEDALYIVNNQENNYSPYFVETREISLPKREAIEIPEEKSVDVIVMYHDVDNNDEKYVKQETIVRFNLIPQSDATEIDGEKYYRINEEDAEFVFSHPNNDFAPYQVDYREAHLGKRDVSQDVDTPDEERKELIERITIYRDLDNNNEVYVKKYVVERFNLIPISDQVRIEGAVCYRIANEDAGYLITNANNNYSPYEVDVEDIELGKRVVVDDLITKFDRKDLVEKIVLYRDIDNPDAIYVKKYVVERFNVIPTGPEVRIMKAACYQISKDDADFIIGNAHNHYSPYEVEIVDFNLEKETEDDRGAMHNEGLVEKMRLYRDLDNKNQIYAKKYLLYRFNIEPTGPEVRIGGALCYPISEEDAVFVQSHQNNGYSPYELIIDNIHLAEELANEEIDDAQLKSVNVEEKNEVEEEKPAEEVVSSDDEEESEDVTSNDEEEEKVVPKENQSEEELTEVEEQEEVNESPITEIVLYRNPENKNEIYANKDTLTRFAIFPCGTQIEVDGEYYYPIRVEDEKRIHDFMNQVLGQKTRIVYRYLPLVQTQEIEEKKEVVEERVSEQPMEHTTPTYESIMEKLFVPSKTVGASRYTPSNIHPSRSFAKELREGDWIYNIVHFLSSTRLVSSEFLQKISSKLLGTREGTDSMEGLRSRVNNLTDEELEVLVREYQDSHGIHQANQVVVERIQKYIMDKLSTYEKQIASYYETIYTYIGQIRVLEESIMEESNVDKTPFVEERRDLVHRLADVAKEMIQCRSEVSRLLGNIHFDGMEKYPFATIQQNVDLPREYQERLKEYERGLQDAIANNDIEGIASNFMGVESCYYQQSDVAVRMIGTRSVGTKYYAPIASEFLFKDDAFERGLFQEVALQSASIHHTAADAMEYVDESSDTDKNEHYVVKDINLDDWRNLINYESSSELEGILKDYANGEIDQEVAISRMDSIARKAQRQYVEVVNAILTMLKSYAQNHPEFDYDSIQEALEYVIAHPESIATTNSGRNVLKDTLYGLPADMLYDLIVAASSVELATQVNREMKKKFAASNEMEEIFRQQIDTSDSVGARRI